MRVIIFLLVLIVSTAASSVAYAGFLSGEDLYRQLTDSNNIRAVHAMGYIAGVTDTLEGILICPPSGSGGVTEGQVSKIVENFLEEHPATWNKPAAVTVRKALSKIWPCNNN